MTSSQVTRADQVESERHQSLEKTEKPTLNEHPRDSPKKRLVCLFKDTAACVLSKCVCVGGWVWVGGVR